MSGLRKAPPTKLSASYQSWRCAGSRQSTTAASSSQACSRSVGIGIIWMGHVENISDGSDVVSKGGCGKHVKAKSFAGPMAKGNELMLSSMIPSAPPSQPDLVEMTEEVREVIFVILYMNWWVMELDKMVQALQKQQFSCPPSESLLDSAR